ncbi:MAG: transporter permease [Nocardia sp.]|uniref:ABC transporter permease n=1 Tax=Nocardia sp. TaxID=1821 RepID=UPI00262D85D9|nr:ABC transporter permease [Nocardia sp.]MCU1646091.1 transporter permease [Nocardia sp.]
MNQAPIMRIPAGMQWTALSERGIRAAFREGDVVLALAAPVVIYICFYIPLRKSMLAAGIDFAQYLLPLTAVYAMFFTAMFAGDRAGREQTGGMATRLRSLPVHPWVPVAARMSANLVRGCAALISALVVGIAFGFRFHDTATALVFVLVALGFGTAVVIGADALGTATRNPELGATVLFVPQLLLVMTSTGFVPAEGFPGWIQGWVRNQPVSQVTAALRGLADGRYPSELWVAALWIGGLLIVGAVLAIRAEGRRA